MHHFDGWNTMEGRHLVFAYAAVILIQGGYVLWTAFGFRQLRQTEGTSTQKKSTKLV